MIELLRLGPVHGWEALKEAVERALTLGCTDVAAVRHPLTAEAWVHGPAALLELGPLERYKRPLLGAVPS